MKVKSVIPIVLGITIAIIGILVITNQDSNKMEVENSLGKEVEPLEEITPEIQEKLDEIEQKNEDAKSIKTDYNPSREREWLTSGKFQIDRSEYAIGEKIFLRVGGLQVDEKGEIVFLRPLNSTHYSVYFKIPFDGSQRSAFNYYLQPQLSKPNEYCSVDDFLGDWRVVFRGTENPNLEFRIIDTIVPGDEDSYEPVC